MPKSVLILGGGFAGLAAARRLAGAARREEVSVRLVDRRDDSVFSPVLPDLISGRVGADHIRYPIAPACEAMGIEFVRAEVRSIDAARCVAATGAGDLRADAMIVALGCDTNFHGNDEMARLAPGLKTIDEGRRIRRSVLDSVAERRGRPANVLVVGGGYTGFEAASHAAQLLHERTRLPFERLGEVARIEIIEVADTVLRNVDAEARRWARRVMGDFGVTIRTGVTAEQLTDARTVRLSDGRTLENATVVWCAGVTPGPAAAGLDVEKRAGGRLGVDQCLRLDRRDNVLAAGDVAGATRPGGERPLRMGVQFSLTAGRHAADNLLRGLRGRSLETYDPLDLGYFVPLAPGKAAGVVLGQSMRGTVPIVLHYAMCVARSWGWSNRAGMLADLACPL